jgi:hypothetical protein
MNAITDISHEQRKHARISASKISRVRICPGSLLAEEALPPEPAGPAALRGTVIHELSEHLLLGTDLPENTDPELLAVAQGYVKAIEDFTQNIKKRYIELNVTEALQEVHPELGGMADYVGVGGGELLVADLKTGRIGVDPTWNPQLLTYALGAALTLRAPRDINVRLAIYQPDAGGWKQWFTTMDDLLDWRDTIAETAVEALKPNAPRNPSTEACRYCRARSVCPAIRNKAVAIAKADFAADAKITNDAIEDAKLCQVFAESVLEKAVTQLQESPTSIPGWKLREGRKMVKWLDRAMAEAILENNKDAWELKSASAVQKLGVNLPAGIVEETRSAPSLVKAKE